MRKYIFITWVILFSPIILLGFIWYLFQLSFEFGIKLNKDLLKIIVG